MSIRQFRKKQTIKRKATESKGKFYLHVCMCIFMSEFVCITHDSNWLLGWKMSALNKSLLIGIIYILHYQQYSWLFLFFLFLSLLTINILNALCISNLPLVQSRMHRLMILCMHSISIKKQLCSTHCSWYWWSP